MKQNLIVAMTVAIFALLLCSCSKDKSTKIAEKDINGLISFYETSAGEKLFVPVEKEIKDAVGEFSIAFTNKVIVLYVIFIAIYCLFCAFFWKANIEIKGKCYIPFIIATCIIVGASWATTIRKVGTVYAKEANIVLTTDNERFEVVNPEQTLFSPMDKCFVYEVDNHFETEYLLSSFDNYYQKGVEKKVVWPIVWIFLLSCLPESLCINLNGE